jgi:hypothetical protein
MNGQRICRNAVTGLYWDGKGFNAKYDDSALIVGIAESILIRNTYDNTEVLGHRAISGWRVCLAGIQRAKALLDA